jgi:hypothetical protein
MHVKIPHPPSGRRIFSDHVLWGKRLKRGRVKEKKKKKENIGKITGIECKRTKKI